MQKPEYINREISWLAFNERVLQEAQDKSVPLVERMRFLGIFSNNLDEFFKVRVATLQRATRISKKPIDPMDFDPEETLTHIHQAVVRLQETFDRTFDQVAAELAKEDVHFIDETRLGDEQKLFVEEYFEKKVRPYLVPLMLNNKRPFPQLKDNAIYLAIELSYKTGRNAPAFALIELSQVLPRFVELPAQGEKRFVMFLDDVIRSCLRKVFGIFDCDQAKAFTIKMTRDAELDIDDDLSTGVMEKMSRSLSQRKKGQYVRLNYDQQMPQPLLDFVMTKTKIKDQEYIIAGGRYHNKKDLMRFPDFGRKDLCYTPQPALEHPLLKGKRCLMDEIRQGRVPIFPVAL